MRRLMAEGDTLKTRCRHTHTHTRTATVLGGRAKLDRTGTERHAAARRPVRMCSPDGDDKGWGSGGSRGQRNGGVTILDTT